MRKILALMFVLAFTFGLGMTNKAEARLNETQYHCLFVCIDNQVNICCGMNGNYICYPYAQYCSG